MSTAIRVILTVLVAWGFFSLTWWAGNLIPPDEGGYWFVMAVVAGALGLSAVILTLVILIWTVRRD